MVICQDANPATVLEPAVPDFHPVGISNANDIAPNRLERAFPDGRPVQLAGIEPD